MMYQDIVTNCMSARNSIGCVLFKSGVIRCKLTHMYSFILLPTWLFRIFVSFALIRGCVSSGVFELQLQSLRNARGELANGRCCDGVRSDGEQALCQDQCESFFRICLKEYQAIISEDGLCNFGNVSSAVLGGNSFSYPKDNTVTFLQLPFDFAWTVSGLLQLSAGKACSFFIFA